MPNHSGRYNNGRWYVLEGHGHRPAVVADPSVLCNAMADWDTLNASSSHRYATCARITGAELARAERTRNT